MSDFLDDLADAQTAAEKVFGYREVLQVAVEPISLAEAQAHLRVDLWGSPPASDDDAWIAAQIPAARAYCEEFLGLSIGQRTIECGMDGFAERIPLIAGPVRSVESVIYIDSNGDPITVDASVYEFNPYDSRLGLQYGQVWPSARSQPNSVKVRYLTGYDLADESPAGALPLPGPIRSAMLLLLGHLYAHREGVDAGSLAELPLGVDALLRQYRVRLGMA